jgi:hypothetical protein
MWVQSFYSLSKSLWSTLRKELFRILWIHSETDLSNWKNSDQRNIFCIQKTQFSFKCNAKRIASVWKLKDWRYFTESWGMVREGKIRSKLTSSISSLPTCSYMIASRSHPRLFSLNSFANSCIACSCCVCMCHKLRKNQDLASECVF